jgi:phage/plasmid primase-like uncharacterized protein
MDLTPFFGGVPFDAPPEQIPATPEAPEIQLAAAMRRENLVPPEIRLDGEFHRFAVGTSKDAGWYKAHADGVPAGCFGSFKDNLTVGWRADIGRSLTAFEEIAVSKRIAEAKKEHEAERKRRAETAALTVTQIWDGLEPAPPNHPYLERKRIFPHFARRTGDGRLVLPLYDHEGNLATLQYIAPDGEKRYHSGGAAKGACALLGTLPAEKVCIAEGFATAASIHESTKLPVFIAYSAGNLASTANFARSQLPTAHIIIIADNDPSGTGQKAAAEAAVVAHAEVVIPPQTGDANDYAVSGGDINTLIMPSSEHWLVHGDSFLTQPAPIRWLIKGWLQDGALSMIHGPSGAGKTFVALDWMLHISSGMPLWNTRKVRQGSVVYLCGEGHHGIRARVAAWAQHHRVSSVGPFYVSESSTDLDAPEGLARVASAVRSLSLTPSVIAIDTLNRFLAGDENSAQDTKRFLDSCAELQRIFGCAVLIVHHTGVNPEAQHRARGSSAWRGALDGEISIEQNRQVLTLTQRKMKDSEIMSPAYMVLEQTVIDGWYDDDGEVVTSAVAVPTDEQPESARDPRLSKDEGALIDAWCATGETRDGWPYLSWSAWKEYLVGTGMTEASARKALNKSGDRLLGRLLESGTISDDGTGYVVVDDVVASVMMMQRVRL